MTLETMMIALYVLLQILDVGTTLWVLRKGGREGNPVVRWFMRWFGELWPVPKFVIAGLLLPFLNLPWLIIVNGMMILVVANNVWAARR